MTSWVTQVPAITDGTTLGLIFKKKKRTKRKAELLRYVTLPQGGYKADEKLTAFKPELLALSHSLLRAGIRQSFAQPIKCVT